MIELEIQKKDIIHHEQKNNFYPHVVQTSYSECSNDVIFNPI